MKATDASETPSAPGAGTQIDRFALQALLHESEASQLWHVIDTGASTSDAPKLVLKLARPSPHAAVRVEVESTLLALLKGKHVPALVAQGEEDGRPYVVMEHLDGPSLQARLQERDLPLDQVIDLAQRLASALHRLHRQGVRHLDLQPRHVTFRADGTPVLLSWGQARHDQQPDLHEQEIDLDNGAYLSPEQIQWQRHDLRSDLFGWAVVVYEALTRHRPFGTPRTPQQLRQRLALQPLPPRALRPDCPGWLQEALLRNLETDPALRHPTAAQLALALRHPPTQRLTERAEWTTPQREAAPWGLRLRACFPWWSAGLGRPPANPLPAPPISVQLHQHPVVVAVVDLRGGPLQATPQAALRHQLEWILSGAPGAHLACIGLTRVEPNPLPAPQPLSALAQLRHWAHPLVHHARTRHDVEVSYHVIECSDENAPKGDAERVAEWADTHLADQLVALPGCLDAFAAEGCPCTFTQVRVAAG